jgi:hypothetical protein
VNIAAPISGYIALFYVSVKAAVGPVADARYKTVLDRVVMNVIDVARQISFIADRMLPITSLPNAFLPFQNLTH